MLNWKKPNTSQYGSWIADLDFFILKYNIGQVNHTLTQMRYLEKYNANSEK